MAAGKRASGPWQLGFGADLTPVAAPCSSGSSRSFSSGFFSTKYRIVHSLGKSATGWSSLSAPKLTPVATMRPDGLRRAGMGLDPAQERPGGRLEAGFRAVFAFQPVLDDLELQRPDGGEQGGPRRRRPGGEGLDDALLQELVQPRPEFLRVGGIGVGDVGEHLGRKPRDLVEKDRAVLGQGVADAERIVADEADDVARATPRRRSRGPGRRACARRRGARSCRSGRGGPACRARTLPEQTRMKAIRSRCRGSMLAWILKMKPENLSLSTGTSRGLPPATRAARLRRDRVLEESVEQELDPEIVDRAAEVDGRLLAGAHGREVEGVARAVEHRELLDDLGEGRVVQLGAHDGVLERGRPSRAPGRRRPGTRSKRWTCRVRRSNTPRNDGPVAERPDDGRRLDPEHRLELVEQRDRVAGRPVALVHEGEDRDPAAPAHLEELAGLRLHALGGVDHHQDRVDRGQHAVGVLGEVLVAGGVEQVDDANPR